MSTKEQREKEDKEVAGMAIFVLGFLLPLAGLFFGPGAWWQYLIWLAIGTIAMMAFSHFEENRS